VRVAIVGAGPAGFYAAGQLLADAQVEAEVDVFDRLPTPWGLVRAGVAPDHPKIKSVSRVFDKIGGMPGFRLYGNVELGTDVTREELLERYHAVLYAVGAQADRRLAIPGEDLPGSHPATEFVAWYNGHPDFHDLRFDLSGDRAVVIGNGNVAIDVARMLCLPDAALRATDTADHALEALAAGRIHEIVVCGRRGPEQAAFTTPELIELGELQSTDVIVRPEDVVNAAGDARNLDVLRDYAARTPLGRERRLVLRFALSPVEIRGDGRVEEIEFVVNELREDDDGVVRAHPTGARETIPCDLVLRSVGYRGVALPGVPFDAARGTIPHHAGRVLGAGGEPLAGEYCVGWIKRGPSGVIGTNKRCASETVASVLEDAAAGRLNEPLDASRAATDALLAQRGVVAVDAAAWTRIDEHERALGAPAGRPRVKLCRRDELLAVGAAV
jgi:ferredoxin/flavodoxin---NADP+ reductase